MPGIKVLLEVKSAQKDPFGFHAAALASPAEAHRQAEAALASLGGLGIELDEDVAPVPMFSDTGGPASALREFAGVAAKPRKGPTKASSMVVPAEVSRARMKELQESDKVTVWPNSEMVVLAEGDGVFDDASSRSGVDCRPFREGVEIGVMRALLGVEGIWADGFRGQNVVVGIIDEGVNGDVYPVIGGFSRPASPRQPGAAPVTSHGSMCAADILIAAPAVRLYDYPFLGVPNSGGALQMFQAVLDQRRADGTPHITNNSYGFVGAGMFEAQKPDISSYSHFFANFGPGRPGGLGQPFDNGTSAATPVAAGVGALLLSAFPDTEPDALKRVLIESAYDLGTTLGHDADHGHGVINAAAAYSNLRSPLVA